MTLQNEPPTSAVLIRRNGERATVEGLSTERFLDLIAEVGPGYFAGYILQPNQQTIEESKP